MFSSPENENEVFYDFTKAMQVPDSAISFSNMRMLHTVNMLPNRHLLIEGGVMEQVVEVYQVEVHAGNLSEPIHTIQTGCRGLNVVETTDDLIYMGFMMSTTDPNSRI